MGKWSRPMKPLARHHYNILFTIIGVAIALRCWHLGTKPLWLDEVIGAIFTLGRGINDIPLNTIFPLSDLPQIFAFQPGQSCAQITQMVATESVHPPFFFCLQYRWLATWLPWLTTDSIGQAHLLAAPHWIWVLRSLPALFGLFGIVGVYSLGRLALEPQTGLIAAALMAVSPFAVYLSQEARHYTLPMLLAILGIIGIVRIQQTIQKAQPLSPLLLVAWISINSVGLYTHYFFLLNFIAQLMALGIWIGWNTFSASPFSIKYCRRYATQLLLSATVVVITYLPWVPTLFHHLNRPETDWLKPYKPDWSDRIAPLYQTIMGWILMVINLPVESQPLAIAIPSAIIMLLFSGWLGWIILQGLQRHWQFSQHRPLLILLLLLLASLILQTLAIVYILDKDITAIPRYNFISYPVLLLLCAIGLTPSNRDATKRDARDGEPSNREPSNRNAKDGEDARETEAIHPKSLISPLSIALCAGFLSTLFVVHGLVFQKGYYPDRVASDMTVFPEEPLVVAVSYRSLQEVALGLSFALELEKQFPTATQDTAYMMFIDRTENYAIAWQQLRAAQHSVPLPLNLWAIASPGMKTKDYPLTLDLHHPDQDAQITCTIDPSHFHRIGFPYQLFHCPSPG
ncbi:MAG: hypothetical protein F6K09_02860 [Merismopedia sp. SIO2A8]|nr:hypothetical protein [Merismopedia sp. SIO2A8]